MKRPTLFLNSRSGSAAPVSDAIRQAAAEHDIEVIDPAAVENLSMTIRERLAEGRKLFISAGGDGTINHVIQSLVNTDGQLGVLPVGTFNHLARDLGLPLDWREALEVALGDETKQIDAGKINDRYFLNNIALGIYPEIVAHRERLRPVHGKWQAYAYATWLAMQSFPHVSLVIEAPHRMDAIKTHFYMVAVNTYDMKQAGIIAPRTSFEEGRLSVYWVPHMPKLQFVRTIARYLSGSLADQSQFLATRSPHLKVQSGHRKMRLAIDGELVEMETPLMISVAPGSMLVKVPKGRG